MLTYNPLLLNLLCGLVGSILTLLATTLIYWITIRKEERIENRAILRNGMKLIHNYAYSDKQIIFNDGYNNIDFLNEVMADFALKFGTEKKEVNELIDLIELANTTAQTLYQDTIVKHGNKIFKGSNWRTKGLDEQARWKEQIAQDNGFNNTLIDVFADKDNMNKFNVIKNKYYQLSRKFLK